MEHEQVMIVHRKITDESLKKTNAKRMVSFRKRLKLEALEKVANKVSALLVQSNELQCTPTCTDIGNGVIVQRLHHPNVVPPACAPKAFDFRRQQANRDARQKKMPNMWCILRASNYHNNTV